MEATVALGPSTLRVPSLGVGAWSWGDARYWGYGARHTSRDVLDAFMASVEGGARLFDTAEVYGHGASEQVLGWLARRSGAPVVLATKYAPLRGRGGAGALLPALRGSLRRMGVARVDLYQVHWADTEEASIDDLMAALADAVAEGLVTAVGVSNFSAEHPPRPAVTGLADRGEHPPTPAITGLADRGEHPPTPAVTGLALRGEHPPTSSQRAQPGATAPGLRTSGSRGGWGTAPGLSPRVGRVGMTWAGAPLATARPGTAGVGGCSPRRARPVTAGVGGCSPRSARPVIAGLGGCSPCRTTAR
jgi:hypothetical protein